MPRVATPASPPAVASATPRLYLVKSEPFVYSFADLTRDKRSMWDGVRNFEARNTLRAMHRGDLLLFYHSNEGKEIAGIAKVVKAAYPDPTAPPEDADWSVVDVAPVCALKKPVTLEAIKAEPRLKDIALLRRNRLSVVPLTDAEFALLLEMGETRLPAKAGPKAKPAIRAAAPVSAKRARPASLRA